MQIPYDSAWVQVFGRLHIVALHFPIALVAVAALLVLWSLVRKQDEAQTKPVSPGLWLVGIAAASAVAASLTGWVFAGAEYADSQGSLGLHRWLGVCSAVLVVGTYVLGVIANKIASARAGRLYIALVLLAAPLVGFTGHVGGGLVHGKNFVFKPLIDSNKSESAPVQTESDQPLDQLGLEQPEELSEEPAEPEADRPLLSGPSVDLTNPKPSVVVESAAFDEDVMPILVRSCIRCHNPDKSRGRVRLDELRHVLRTVEPGKPDESLLVYTIELPEHDEDSMPKNEPPLPDIEIATIRAWIASLEAE